MRIGILVVSFLLLLALFAVESYSIDWSNPSGRSVDQMLTEGKARSPTLTQVAQASRAAETEQAGSQAENPTTAVEPAVTNDAAENQIESMSVSGKWSLEIADSTFQSAVLTLYQSGDAVFGKGFLSEDNNTITLTASGSVASDKLNLDLVTLEKIGLYRISMTVSGNSATGSYTAFSPLASPSTGTATGLRSVSSS
jgi:hypothetical protein